MRGTRLVSAPGGGRCRSNWSRRSGSSPDGGMGSRCRRSRRRTGAPPISGREPVACPRAGHSENGIRGFASHAAAPSAVHAESLWDGLGGGYVLSTNGHSVDGGLERSSSAVKRTGWGRCSSCRDPTSPTRRTRLGLGGEGDVVAEPQGGERHQQRMGRGARERQLAAHRSDSQGGEGEAGHSDGGTASESSVGSLLTAFARTFLYSEIR